MKLLCVSNGHGEDSIAVSLAQALGRCPQPPAVAALPLVGMGHAYRRAGVPIMGPVQSMPSGGFVYMDPTQLVGDVQSGLLQLSWQQLQTLRAWGRAGGRILAVGDVLPLALAWISGAAYGFVGTAKSDYWRVPADRAEPSTEVSQLRGSVYLPWERWLMNPRRCRGVFVRDQFTADHLQAQGISAHYCGNPMMDSLGCDPQRLASVLGGLAIPEDGVKLVLLPGSRVPEAQANWGQILEALATVVAAFGARPVTAIAAIAPSLEQAPFQQELAATPWQSSAPTADSASPATYRWGVHQLRLVQLGYGECLHWCDAAIAQAGTATEQVVGLGKPVFTFPGKGPQFTLPFAQMQQRLLGRSVLLLEHPHGVGIALKACLEDAAGLRQIQRNGVERMGVAGAADRIAGVLQTSLLAPPSPGPAQE